MVKKVKEELDLDCKVTEKQLLKEQKRIQDEIDEVNKEKREKERKEQLYKELDEQGKLVMCDGFQSELCPKECPHSVKHIKHDVLCGMQKCASFKRTITGQTYMDLVNTPPVSIQAVCIETK